ncbi:hypothetical protein NDU88_000674 [Pleurodeles waltl]|uniref:Uncharacterized protein n=1 Tax=Pleurodeles waltl TaxID=8319 RepID=A0AAV7LWH8_PLEWA|nr:hypothetical protein NDU88_000674 [Pleurodeles waltl]
MLTPFPVSTSSETYGVCEQRVDNEFVDSAEVEVFDSAAGVFVVSGAGVINNLEEIFIVDGLVDNATADVVGKDVDEEAMATVSINNDGRV